MKRLLINIWHLLIICCTICCCNIGNCNPLQSLQSNTSGSLTATFTAGSTLVLCLCCKGGTLTNITTNHSQTFILVDTATSGVNTGCGGYLLNNTGGSTTITVNMTGSPLTRSFSLYEYTANDAFSFDLHAVNGYTTGTNPISGTTGTTNFTTETIVGWVSSLSATGTTAGSGYSNLNIANLDAVLEDKTVIVTGTQQATFTQSNSILYLCGVMTFQKKLNIHNLPLIGVG